MTPAQIEILRTELLNPTYNGLTPQEVTDILFDRSLVVNTDPVPQVPKPITANAVKTLLAAITITEEAKAELIRLVIEGNRVGIASWADLYLTNPQAQLVKDYLAQTVPDPNYPAQVLGECRAEEIGLGGHILFSEVDEARN